MESKQLTSPNLLFELGFRGFGFVLFVFKERRYDPIQTGLTLPAATCAQVGQIKEDLEWSRQGNFDQASIWRVREKADQCRTT